MQCNFPPIILCIRPFPFLPPWLFHPCLPHRACTAGSRAGAFGSEMTNSLWEILLTAWAVPSDAEQSCTLSRAVGSPHLASSALGVPIGNKAPGYVRFPLPCRNKSVLRVQREMGTVCTLGAYGRWTKHLLFILLNSENQIDTWIHSTLISRIPNPYYTEQFAITNYLFYEMANFHSSKLCQHKLLKQKFDHSAVKYIDSQRIESVSIVFKHQMISDLIKNILSLKIWNDKNWNLQLLKDLCTEREAISRKQPLIHLHFYLGEYMCLT